MQASFFSFLNPFLNVLLLSFILGTSDWLPFWSTIMPERFCWENLGNSVKAGLALVLFASFLSLFGSSTNGWAFFIALFGFAVIILKNVIMGIQAYLPSYSNWLAFSKSLKMGLMTLIRGLGYLVNESAQAFCQPVPFVRFILVGVAISAIFAPVSLPRAVGLILAFWQGIGCIVSIYCLWFAPIAGLVLIFPFLLLTAGFMWLQYFPIILFIFVLLFGLEIGLRKNLPFSSRLILFTIGGTIALPFMILVSNISHLRRQDKWHKGASILGIISLSFIGVCGINDYNVLAQKLNYGSSTEAILKDTSTIKLLQTHYMGERIVGFHFKYHTAYCDYDGWRPPLHDPFATIAYHIYGDPIQADLPSRIALYKTIFPNLPVHLNCVCAPFNRDAQGYLKAAF